MNRPHNIKDLKENTCQETAAIPARHYNVYFSIWKIPSSWAWMLGVIIFSNFI
jgi:hypothetical protein